jgi:hypothetical protein
VDDKHKRGSPDNKRIATHEAYELRRWAEKFGVPQAQVVAAVKVVGDSAAAVEAYLKKRK